MCESVCEKRLCVKVSVCKSVCVKASVCKSFCVQKRLCVKGSVCEKLYEGYDANFCLLLVTYCHDTTLLVCL